MLFSKGKWWKISIKCCAKNFNLKICKFYWNSQENIDKELNKLRFYRKFIKQSFENSNLKQFKVKYRFLWPRKRKNYWPLHRCIRSKRFVRFFWRIWRLRREMALCTFLCVAVLVIFILHCFFEVHYFLRMCLTVLMARFTKKKAYILDQTTFGGNFCGFF